MRHVWGQKKVGGKRVSALMPVSGGRRLRKGRVGVRGGGPAPSPSFGCVPRGWLHNYLGIIWSGGRRGWGCGGGGPALLRSPVFGSVSAGCGMHD